LEQNQINTVNLQKIYGDPHGTPIHSYFNFVQNFSDKFLLFFGPEGGLTADEEKQLDEHGFMACALTQTILRAVQAATLLVGICRTYFS